VRTAAVLRDRFAPGLAGARPFPAATAGAAGAAATEPATEAGLGPNGRVRVPSARPGADEPAGYARL